MSGVCCTGRILFVLYFVVLSVVLSIFSHLCYVGCLLYRSYSVCVVFCCVVCSVIDLLSSLLCRVSVVPVVFCLCCILLCCCCCCRPHSTNVLPAESSTRNHVAASSLSPQVARKGSTLSGFVQRSRLEREVGRDLHSNKWEEV